MGSGKLRAEADLRRETLPQYKMDTVVGYTLQAGVLLSLALISAGLIWKWVATGGLVFDYRLRGMNLFHLAAQQFRLAAHGTVRPRLLVNLGVIVLLLTPYSRVLASVAYFTAILKNWKYSLFTSVVFIVLTYCLFLR